MEPSARKSWVDRIRNGDRIALAKALTLAESSLTDDRVRALELLAMAEPRPVKSLRLAITGPPGAGKSTLIEALGMEFINRGLRVAVLTIDPSSPRSGGSILGDKTRMKELSADPRAFIRPSPSSGAVGGVAPRTHEAITLAEAAGYQVVLVETVGVGQSEFVVSDMTDAVILVMLPGAGDGIQAMKRGIIEIADGVIINKCDGQNENSAMMARTELEQALMLRSSDLSGEPVRVTCCSALTRKGIPELAEYWLGFRTRDLANGMLLEQRRQQAWKWVTQQLSGLPEESFRKAAPWLDLLKVGKLNEYEVLLNVYA